MKVERRWSNHPKDVLLYGTDEVRNNFLINDLMKENQIIIKYLHYDRFIVGSIVPTDKLRLNSFNFLKSNFFLERREIGVINLGGNGTIEVDSKQYELSYKDALYIAKDSKEIFFESDDDNNPSFFYFNSTVAHKSYETRLIKFKDVSKIELGSLETSNHRIISQMLVSSNVKTCQLQMGITELKPGSVWNTMPAHIHDRRMEVYLYFEVPQDQAVCHFMGEPNNTRHLWLKNFDCAISPPWSIHCGAGTSNYSFIWGMGGENLDYGDMELIDTTELR